MEAHNVSSFTKVVCCTGDLVVELCEMLWECVIYSVGNCDISVDEDTIIGVGGHKMVVG